VIDWDANYTDMDLWVKDPKEESCSYSNKNTKLGGRISNDITGGYGPEEFMLKHAVDGKFGVDVKFYASTKQSKQRPVTVRDTLFTNYGTKRMKRAVVSLQIENKHDDVYHVGDLTFTKAREK
jgi:uncharacterized protein YfaP (DUF2135 family)